MVEPMAGLKIGFSAILSETIPRAHQLAIIATVDAIADGFAKLFWNFGAMLDSQIRYAASRIDPVRFDDRCGRADIDTTGTATTVFREWRIDFKRHIGIALTEKKP